VAKRRGQGTGRLEERPPGSGTWRVQYALGIDPATGRRRRGSTTFQAQGRREAEKKAAAIISSLERGAPGTGANLSTVLEEWMRFQSGRGRSPTTLHGYQSLIDQRINPSLGAIPVGQLTPHHLDAFYLSLEREDGSGPLSPMTVRNIHRVISAALNQAVKWGWIERSPADRATLPSPQPKPLVVPTPDEIGGLIRACQGRDQTLGAFVFLAAVTGCRRGELAALTWSDVEQTSLVIRRSAYVVGKEKGIKDTKSGKVRRVQIDPAISRWLEQWHHRCAAEANEAGVVLVPDAFVFPGWPDGSRPVNIKSVGARVREVADALGLRHVHLHSLRHFAATELLAAGINPRDAADMLGHADPSITLRVYAHATVDRQRAAAAALAAVVDVPD